MPRLSLYRPEKANDFSFIDRLVLEQFMVGGTDIYIHKYLGPADPVDGTATPTTPMQNSAIPELGIQDLLLLENRDRKYSDDVYIMRCIYNMQQLDWSLTQFGLFLANDTIFIHIHLNDSVKRIGRKLMPGDVLELPHLKDPHALNDASVALRRFYVVDEVLRPTEGFSQTWYPHLIKLKCKPMIDSQEFNDILSKPAVDVNDPYSPDSNNNNTLRDIISSFNMNMEINNQIVAQAEADAPLSGYDTENFWMVPIDQQGKIMLVDDDGYQLDASEFYVGYKDDNNDWVYTTREGDIILNPNSPSIENPAYTNLELYGVPVIDTSIVLKSPRQNYYLGYLLGDTTPPNGYRVAGMGVQFPDVAVEGMFYIRTDYMPNRLFRYSEGGKWTTFEDNVRMTLSNTNTRNTLKTSFINNTNQTTIGNKVIDERQAISKSLEIGKNLKPKADN
jgi:hypothetical protein